MGDVLGDDEQGVGLAQTAQHVRALAGAGERESSGRNEAGARELALASRRGEVLLQGGGDERTVQVRQTAEASYDRAHERLERHVAAHRVARQGEDRNAVTHAPEALRHAGLHGDLGELHGAQTAQHSLDRVVGAHAHPTAGEDEIASVELVLDRGDKRIVVVDDRPDAVGQRTRFARGGHQKEAVGVVDLPRPQRIPGFDEFGPRGDDGHARLWMHAHDAVAGGREQGELARAQLDSRLEHLLTRLDVLTGATDAGAHVDTRVDLHGARATVGALDRDDRIGTIGHGCAGHDPHRRAARHHHLRHRPGGNVVDDAKIDGCVGRRGPQVGGQDRVAVHRGVVEGRQAHRGAHGSGEHAAVDRRQRKVDG